MKQIKIAVLVLANVSVFTVAGARVARAEGGFFDCCEKVAGTPNTYVCISDGCFFTHDCSTNQDCVRVTY